jgi:hypothetical protein
LVAHQRQRTLFIFTVAIIADFKFETDPYDVELHGLMTPEQYTEAIENLNNKLRPSRSGKADGMLLAAGPLLVPLALWGVRHRNQAKRRKRLLKEGIHEFNMQYQELLMRWHRRPDSVLTIERRHAQPGAGTTDQEMAMAQATMVSDGFAPATPLDETGTQQSLQLRQPTQSLPPTRPAQLSQPPAISSSGLV